VDVFGRNNRHQRDDHGNDGFAALTGNSGYDAYKFVRVDGDVVYRSPAFAQIPELLAQLPPFKGKDAFSRYPLKKIANAEYQYLQIDFDYQGSGQGTVFVVSKIDPVTYFIRKYYAIVRLAIVARFVNSPFIEGFFCLSDNVNDNIFNRIGE